MRVGIQYVLANGNDPPTWINCYCYKGVKTSIFIYYTIIIIFRFFFFIFRIAHVWDNLLIILSHNFLISSTSHILFFIAILFCYYIYNFCSRNTCTNQTVCFVHAVYNNTATHLIMINHCAHQNYSQKKFVRVGYASVVLIPSKDFIQCWCNLTS